MKFVRISIILFVASVSLTLSQGVFSASGEAKSASGVSRTVVDIEDRRILALENQDTEKKAQELILEVYKAQWAKVIRDIDQSLQKVNPDPKVRVEAYTSIQKTLELRKQKIEKSDMSDSSKNILSKYIDHMISILESKKESLE